MRLVSTAVDIPELCPRLLGMLGRNGVPPPAPPPPEPRGPSLPVRLVELPLKPKRPDPEALFLVCMGCLRGRCTVKVEPMPSREVTSTRPLWHSTSCLVILRPAADMARGQREPWGSQAQQRGDGRDVGSEGCASPSPVPPNSRPMRESTCSNSLKIHWILSFGMPMPVSTTEITTASSSFT